MFTIFKRKEKKQEKKEEVVEKTVETKPPPSFIETYPVFEPFVYVGIEQEPTGALRYVVIEPALTPAESELLEQIKQMLKVALKIDVKTFKGGQEAEGYLRDEVLRIVKRFELKIRKPVFEKLMYYLVRDLMRYGVIDPLMRDPLIEDISCNGPSIPLYVWHRDYESMPTNVVFPDQESLDKFIMRMAYISGRHLSVAQPIIDASLPDGSRIQMTYGTEVTKRGSTFTIRKFKEDPFSITDLIRLGTLNSEIAALMWFILENKGSILVAGGTASGKTTTINCLSMFIRPEAKVVTIEDTPEIRLAHVNWIQSVTRVGIGGIGEIDLYDLLKAALRQRPDFIIVGEIRGAEAVTLFQAISTGHAGLSSIHADSVPAVLRRLVSEPMNIPRTLVPAINFILLQARLTIGERPARRILSVSELVGLDPRSNEFITNDVFIYQPVGDTFTYGGRSYIAERMAKSRGMSYEELRKELTDRKAVLDWMVQKRIRRYQDVAEVIGSYYRDKEALLNQVRIEAL